MKKFIPTLLFSISWKELVNQRKLLTFMVVSLFLGLLSFILINSFKTSLDFHIAGKSQEMMTGDVRLFARRPLKEKELNFLNTLFSKENVSTRVSYFTMAQTATADRFSEVQIVSTNFPLYGEIEFEDFNGKAVLPAEAMKTLATTPSIAVYPEIRYAFSLKENDVLQVGKQRFNVKYIVEKDAGAEINFAGLAPKIYIAEPQYDFAEISGKGNVIRHYAFVKNNAIKTNNAVGNSNASLPPANPEELAKYLKEEMKPLLGEYDSPLSVRAHTGSGSQIERVLKFITSYLSLVSLIALFLSGVGIAYLFRNFVHDKLKETAILRTLGLTQNETFFVSLLQLMFIGVLASTITAITAYFLVPYIPGLFQRFLPEGFIMFFSWKSVLTTYALSIFGAVIFCLPILVATKDLSLSYLFTGQIRFYNDKKAPLIWCFVLIAATFFGTSVWLSNSLQVGAVFSASFFGFFVLLFGLGISIILALKFFFNKLPFIYDFSIKSIRHHRFSTIFYFLSISLGVMLITTITQMEKTITNEIKSPEDAVLPTFFLFNIPDEKVEPLETLVKKNGEELKNISPLVGARLVSINENLVKASEQPKDNERGDTQRWRERDNRRVNISFREALIPGEELIAGKPLNSTEPREEGIFRLSIEKDYAKERDVKIGDTLTFQMLDMPVTLKAKIHNIRNVKWNTFQPNFWLIFEPYALEAFPKVFLGMISGVDEQKKNVLQSSIVRSFPDVSMIDVLKLIKEVLGIVQQIGLLVQVMALFSISLGMFILFSIVNYQVLTKWKEINLLKVLGCGFFKIATLVVFEYLTLGILSLISGIGSGIALSYFFSSMFFENSFSLAATNLIYLAAFICFMIIIIVGVAIQKPLREPSNILLKENSV